MKKPQNLKKGSVVRIISTARKISAEAVKPSIDLLKSWGLIVQLGNHVYCSDNQFAGNTKQRTADLQDALNDPNVDAIWCSRGGYGTTMLIDSIDFSAFLKHPKWIIGFSDITSLLCHTSSFLQTPSIHGIMPISIHSEHSKEVLASIESLKTALFGGTLNYALPSHGLNKPGNGQGTIIGGNLSIVYSILGSKSSPSTEGKILFLEDLDEYLYHIDRMMVNLKRNGLFEKVSGVIIGGLSDMNDNTIPYGLTAEEIVSSHLSEYSFPVYYGFDAGHVSPNLALPFGLEATVTNSVLSIEC